MNLQNQNSHLFLRAERHNINDILREIIRSRFYEADYKNVTQKLLYEDISYDYAVENGIAKIVQTDLFDYKITEDGK